ncbi:MAG: glycosyltransferase family 2 protein [Chloroflexota bacterium]|nr:glycosyltransferase family 2 protein [Chloroflexota bacterium]
MTSVTDGATAPRPRLTFFFPAFDEEENVERTVDLALEKIAPMVDSIEVLIVDDGSRDRTPQLADALAAADPRVSVYHQPNRGYGGALKAGFRNARGELVAFSDGDLQFDLNELRLLLDRLDDREKRPVDAVIGWRIKRRDPPHRILIAKTYNAIVSLAFGLRVRDIDCAMKVFRREVFEGLRLDADGPFLSAEMLIKLRARGVRMAQVGVHHYPRAAGTNTGASFRKILRTFSDIGRLRWALWFNREATLADPSARD